MTTTYAANGIILLVDAHADYWQVTEQPFASSDLPPRSWAVTVEPVRGKPQRRVRIGNRYGNLLSPSTAMGMRVLAAVRAAAAEQARFDAEQAAQAAADDEAERRYNRGRSQTEMDNADYERAIGISNMGLTWPTDNR